MYLAIMLSQVRLAELTGAAAAVRVRCLPGQIVFLVLNDPWRRAAQCHVGSPAIRVYVGVAAAAEPAAVHVVAAADLSGRSRPLGCG